MKNQKQTFRKIVGFLNNREEDGGFWLPNIQRHFVWIEEQICRLFDSILAVSRGRFDAQIYTDDKSQLGNALSREVSHRSAIEPSRAPVSKAQTLQPLHTRSILR